MRSIAPWDCSGMILLQTNVPKSALSKLHPVLVDENKKEMVDTLYGTNKDTYDPCVFLSYDLSADSSDGGGWLDKFCRQRLQKISFHIIKWLFKKPLAKQGYHTFSRAVVLSK